MPLYGYARVSAADQDLQAQETALRAAGCEVIRVEKVTGATREGRVELATLLYVLRAGDTLVVTRVDRLARSIRDLKEVMRALKAKGVALKTTEQPIDTSTAFEEAFLSMPGVFSAFESDFRHERRMECIASAKDRDVYGGKGRPWSIDPSEVRRLRDEEKLGPTAIARKLGIGCASVYRILAEMATSAS